MNGSPSGMRSVFKLSFTSKLFMTVTCVSLLMTGCSSSSLPIQYLPSQNYNARVKYIVIHYTAGNYEESMNYLVHGNRVSSHYLIPENHDESYPDDDLKVFQLVDESYRAWHAGVSQWGDQENLNDLSVGIELVNAPECHRHISEIIPENITSDPDYASRICYYPDFDPEQIQLLIALIQKLQEYYPNIKPTNIVGHSDIAPNRKSDPGPRFPWNQLYQEGIGAWYDPETSNKYWHIFATRKPEIDDIQKAFKAYGYNIVVTGKYDKQTENVVTAFQTHFLPWDINGEANLVTVAALFALVEKYHPQKLRALLPKEVFTLTKR